jgi:hypothetical protein
MYVTKVTSLLTGSLLMPHKPYLSLSGTSMAAPVVAGTVALMVQANPSLTPNMVKAIVQYTAQRYKYDALTQGAGFLNTHGAVQLARFFRTARYGDRLPMSSTWSKQVIWGNRRINGGVIKPNANAFQLGTPWGLDEDNIVWGTLFDADGDNIVWGTHGDDDNIVWGTMDAVDNIVWGTDCGGADCDNIVWGTNAGLVDNIVWGTAEEVR